MTTAIAMSGGMDSLFTLLLVREQGEDVFALHARFIPVPPERDPVPSLTKLCREMDIPLHVVDLTEAFHKHVILPFVEEYRAGKTPNPCARCNAAMKFGLLADAACSLGADALATGHYARITSHPQWGTTLTKGVDPVKDQSYFLSLVPQKQLAKACMPLGNWHKSDVKEQLKTRRMTPPLPSESQEICFIPNDDYRAFLLQGSYNLPGSGAIITTEGKRVGTHAGLWNYTEGQRRGLGIAWSEPLYVIEKNIERNTLVVGIKDFLSITGCSASEVNFLVPYEQWPTNLLVRTRYRQHASPATIEKKCTSEGTTLIASFSEPIQPPALGQVLAVFDENGTVLAGGIITENYASPSKKRTPRAE